jgi:Zn-dependent peptidase ImmA (M78 family)
MRELQRLGLIVWLSHQGMLPMPKIIAHRGIRYLGKRFSYYDPNTHTIALARNQRNTLTLMHELVHAMGCENHDSEFVDLYANLLKSFTKIDSDKLLKLQ